MSVQDAVKAAFVDRFGEAPQFVARAPGRVNLIGDHTDYNAGFALPVAIDRAVWIALRPRDDRRVLLHPLDFDMVIDFDLDHFQKDGNSPAEYVKGVARALLDGGYDLRGWEGVVGGDVPIGAGLSSSAALEVATARAFCAVSGFVWDADAMARIGQKAENQWVGVNSGLMDQLSSAHGVDGHALFMDFRAVSVTPVPLPDDLAIVILNTNTARELAGSAYNERRAQCEQASAIMAVSELRDASMMHLNAQRDVLGDVLYRRAKHVITENRRVKIAVEALQAGDMAVLSDAINASHDSLRDDYEVSSRELDIMVEAAHRQAGCYGARMTGGGFGGCAVALVKPDAVADFTQAVSAAYTEQTGITPEIYVCRAAEGASLVTK